MLNRIITLVLLSLMIFILSACGAGSPSGSGSAPAGSGGVASLPPGAAGLSLTVNFPIKQVGLSGLISPNTHKLEISVSKGAAYNPNAIIASTTITAPPGGGPATGTLIVPPGIVSIDIVSKDTMANWLGEVQELNKTLQAGLTTSIITTLVEAGQGIDLNALGVLTASRPTVYSPDGTSYSIYKVALQQVNTASGPGYNITTECEAASTTVALKVIDSLAPLTTPTYRTGATVSNSIISGILTFTDQNGATSKDYIFTLNFGALNNIPTLTITQSAAGLPAPAPKNTTITQKWANNVVPMTHNRAYVTNWGSNTVSVIDTLTNTPVATIPVGINPYGVDVNPQANRAYITNETSGTVSVIDTLSNTVVATIPAGSGARGVAVNLQTNKAYVANWGGDTVSVIDTATDTLVGTINTGAGTWPHEIAIHPVTGLVYVANNNSILPGNSVSVIDPVTYLISMTYSGPGPVLLGKPYGIALNPPANMLYVTNVSSNSVSVINTAANTFVTTINVGLSPRDITVNPQANRVYVANATSNTVSVIDTLTNTIVATIAVGVSPRGVTVNPAANKMYVTNYLSGNISVIDTVGNTVAATVIVGVNPRGVAVIP